MDSLELLSQLIRFASVSSKSNRDISEFVADQLSERGFEVEISEYDDAGGIGKCNVVAKREPGTSRGNSDAHEGIPKGVAYFAHTDVVPADQWVGAVSPTSPECPSPFEPEWHEERLYGRGACDMKGSLAAMLTAVSAVDQSEQSDPIWVIATADEEVGFDGARQMTAHSELYREIVRQQPLAIIGEPTELHLVHAHKGITGFEVVSHGRAAHSSSDDGVNANEKMLPILNRISEIGKRAKTDESLLNHSFDPPHLSWNYGISDSMRTLNITPPRSRVWVSLRPMPNVSGEELISEVRQLAIANGLEFNVYPGGPPLWTEPGSRCVGVLAELTDTTPAAVCYGTDGCVLDELHYRVVLGPGSIAQAHTADEWISLDQLAKGTELYGKIIRRFATAGTVPGSV